MKLGYLAVLTGAFLTVGCSSVADYDDSVEVSQAAATSASLVGEWTLDFGEHTRWIFGTDHHYAVEHFGKKGKRTESGTYRVNGDRLTLTHNHLEALRTEWQFSVTEKKLYLVVLVAKGKHDGVVGTWHAKYDPDPGKKPPYMVEVTYGSDGKVTRSLNGVKHAAPEAYEASADGEVRSYKLQPDGKTQGELTTRMHLIGDTLALGFDRRPLARVRTWPKLGKRRPARRPRRHRNR
jgi:hypothetical protein